VLAGSVRIQSGTATDGVRLPLPPSVTEAAVTAGDVTLHVSVTPRYAFDPSAPDTIHAVARCEVDDDRVVRCRLFTIGAAQAEIPGVCDYVVLAAPAS
jgi:hypothetical protein